MSAAPESPSAAMPTEPERIPAHYVIGGTTDCCGQPAGRPPQDDTMQGPCEHCGTLCCDFCSGGHNDDEEGRVFACRSCAPFAEQGVA